MAEQATRDARKAALTPAQLQNFNNSGMPITAWVHIKRTKVPACLLWNSKQAQTTTYLDMVDVVARLCEVASKSRKFPDVDKYMPRQSRINTIIQELTNPGSTQPTNGTLATWKFAINRDFQYHDQGGDQRRGQKFHQEAGVLYKIMSQRDTDQVVHLYKMNPPASDIHLQPPQTPLEDIYELLVDTHLSLNNEGQWEHHGRDTTYENLLRGRSATITKECVTDFIARCPGCTRRLETSKEAAKIAEPKRANKRALKKAAREAEAEASPSPPPAKRAREMGEEDKENIDNDGSPKRSRQQSSRPRRPLARPANSSYQHGQSLPFSNPSINGFNSFNPEAGPSNSGAQFYNVPTENFQNRYSANPMPGQYGYFVEPTSDLPRFGNYGIQQQQSAPTENFQTGYPANPMLDQYEHFVEPASGLPRIGNYGNQQQRSAINNDVSNWSHTLYPSNTQLAIAQPPVLATPEIYPTTWDTFVGQLCGELTSEIWQMDAAEAQKLRLTENPVQGESQTIQNEPNAQEPLAQATNSEDPSHLDPNFDDWVNFDDDPVQSEDPQSKQEPHNAAPPAYAM